MSKIKRNLSDIAREMMSGVVQIHVEGNLEEDIQSVMNPAIRIPGIWSGSGFFVEYEKLEGYIVTNAHVARNAVKLEKQKLQPHISNFNIKLISYY